MMKLEKERKCYSKKEREAESYLLVEYDFTDSSTSINCINKITYSRKREIK